MIAEDQSARGARREPATLVRDLMTSPAVTIRADDHVIAAARVLDGLSITSLPVVDDDLRLLGILSEADIVARLSRGAGSTTKSPRVGAVMTQRVRWVSADDDLASLIELMSAAVLKSLPVLLHGRVVGMISRRDVVGAFSRGDLDGPAAEALMTT